MTVRCYRWIKFCRLISTDMSFWWTPIPNGCRLWHAELAFFVVVTLMASRAVTADESKDRNLQGLDILTK